MITIVTDLRNAYEAHDHDEFHRHLKRLEEMLRYAGPVRLVHCARHEQVAPCQRCVQELMQRDA